MCRTHQNDTFKRFFDNKCVSTSIERRNGNYIEPAIRNFFNYQIIRKIFIRRKSIPLSGGAARECGSQQDCKE